MAAAALTSADCSHHEGLRTIGDVGHVSVRGYGAILSELSTCKVLGASKSLVRGGRWCTRYALL
jgi:hypothetical protein